MHRTQNIVLPVEDIDESDEPIIEFFPPAYNYKLNSCVRINDLPRGILSNNYPKL